VECTNWYEGSSTNLPCGVSAVGSSKMRAGAAGCAGCGGASVAVAHLLLEGAAYRGEHPALFLQLRLERAQAALARLDSLRQRPHFGVVGRGLRMHRARHDQRCRPRCQRCSGNARCGAQSSSHGHRPSPWTTAGSAIAYP